MTNGKITTLHGYSVGNIVRFTEREVSRESKYAGEWIVIGFVPMRHYGADRIEMHRYPVIDAEYTTAGFHQVQFVREK